MAGQTQGDVAICNRALGKVGGTRITDFQDGSAESNLCLDNYTAIRDEVTSASDWSFARIRHRLSPLADKPIGYEYAYAIPANVLVVREVFRDEDARDQLTTWDVETNDDDQSLIVANPAGNQPFIWTRSTRIVEDPARFSPLYVAALIARLAAEFAIPIAQSGALMRALWREYEMKLPDATSSDGQQGRSKRVHATSLISVRSGGGGPWAYYPKVG